MGLLLAGYLIGRWQDSPAPAVALPPAPTVAASASQDASAAAEEPVPTTSPPPTPRVYPTLQAEAADEKVGIEAQDTEDQGGGQNVGWIANGDRLRFDDFEFGEVPATKVDVRVATDAQDGGRMEIRLDSADGPVIGTMRVTRTGGWQTWRTDEVTLTPTTGKHTIFLVFARDDGSEFLNVNWLLFGH
ncbi:carbohydrate-binding protein [Actinoplanes sp. NPDC048796]|uniref:carbohydrate-binding protein n=1 Tax=unclassified Actinoplanes TaxID=2626549 RepID=UPI00340D93B4